jgi:hypothetical protein
MSLVKAKQKQAFSWDNVNTAPAAEIGIPLWTRVDGEIYEETIELMFSENGKPWVKFKKPVSLAKLYDEALTYEAGEYNVQLAIFEPRPDVEAEILDALVAKHNNPSIKKNYLDAVANNYVQIRVLGFVEE